MMENIYVTGMRHQVVKGLLLMDLLIIDMQFIILLKMKLQALFQLNMKKN